MKGRFQLTQFLQIATSSQQHESKTLKISTHTVPTNRNRNPVETTVKLNQTNKKCEPHTNNL